MTGDAEVARCRRRLRDRVFAEPGVSVEPVRGGERSIGITAGLLFALR